MLIIGILAAIALPQYTKAVERSRMAEAAQVLGDLATAESINYMQEDHFFAVIPGTKVGGDVEIQVPAANTAWTFEGTPTDATASAPSYIKIAATRNEGMYKGGVFTIQIDADGKITKSCGEDSSATSGFCTVAKTMGYN